MSEARSELLEESPFKLMIKLSIPAIIGMVVIGLYSFMDGVYAGQLIGENAMGAVSVAYPITFLNSGIATLIGIGSSSILARSIGKGDKDTVDKIMGNLLCLVIIFSLIITIIGTIFTRELLYMSGAEGEILEMAVRYLRIVFLGSVFVNFAQSANMVMRGEGLMKKAMTFMGIGAILNIILDPIFIIALGEKGIEGAAIATILSQFVQALITMLYFIKKSKYVRFYRIGIDKNLLPELISVGFSAMLMQLMSIVQQTLMYRMAGKYGGSEQVILMAASMRIQAFSFIPLWGMSQGLQPVVGTNYGAKLYDRVKKSTNTFLLGATVLAACFWIPIELFPRQVLSLFIKNEAIVNVGIDNFRIMYSLFPLLGTMIMSITFFQSIGNGKNAGTLVLLKQILLFIPAIVILPKYWGISAVWITSPLVDGSVLVLSLIFLFREYSKMKNEEISNINM